MKVKQKVVSKNKTCHSVDSQGNSKHHQKAYAFFSNPSQHLDQTCFVACKIAGLIGFPLSRVRLDGKIRDQVKHARIKKH